MTGGITLATGGATAGAGAVFGLAAIAAQDIAGLGRPGGGITPWATFGRTVGAATTLFTAASADNCCQHCMTLDKLPDPC